MQQQSKMEKNFSLNLQQFIMWFKFLYKVFIVLVAASKLFESSGFVHEFSLAIK